MPKVINVVGLGPISFPDSMGDDAISRAIETEIIPQNKVRIGAAASMQNRAAGGDLPPGYSEQSLANPGPTTAGGVISQQAGFAGKEVGNAVKSLGDAFNPITHPENLIAPGAGLGREMVKAQIAPMRQAAQDFQKGNYASGAVNAATGAVPIAGPMIRGAVDQARQGNLGGPLAQVAMMEGPRAISTLMRGASAVGPTEAGAVADYAKGANVPPDVAQRFVSENKIMRNPRADVAAYAEERLPAANTALDTAVAAMKQPVDAQNVVASILETKKSLYNPKTGGPLFPDSDAVAAKLDAYAADHVLANSEVSLQPDGTLTFAIDPKTARVLKQNFDVKPGARGMYGESAPETPATDVKAQTGVADALRTELNADPNVASANKEVSFLMNLKNNVAPEATQAKPIGSVPRLVTKAAIGGVAATVGGHAFGGTIASIMGLSEAVKMVRDVVTNPGWKTASAVTKAKFARAVSAKDWSGAAQVGQGITAGGIDAQEQAAPMGLQLQPAQ